MIYLSHACHVRKKAVQRDEASEALLRKLDRRARMVLGLFARQDSINANDVANVLGLSQRQVRDLLAEWVNAGWLVVNDASRKSRAYSLSADYRRFIGDLSAE
jgi:predicted ArsR family transcriptional regulator